MKKLIITILLVLTTNLYSQETHPFLDAVWSENENTVIKMLNDGTDPNTQINNQPTALMYYASKNNVKMVKILLKHGANVNQIAEQKERTALTYICMNDNNGIDYNEMILLLLQNGANINHKDKKGRTPLMISSSYGNYKIVKLLIEKGADIHIKSRHGDTALSFACSAGNPQGEYIPIIDLLISKGADINNIGELGNTPLINASKNCNEQIIKMLLSKGANFKLKNEANKSALDYAIENNCNAIINLLK